MLESVKQLEQMGFQLFASLGTADFYSDNGVKVCCPLCSIVALFMRLTCHEMVTKKS